VLHDEVREKIGLEKKKLHNKTVRTKLECLSWNLTKKSRRPRS
jgi:hypothetical protein